MKTGLANILKFISTSFFFHLAKRINHSLIQAEKELYEFLRFSWVTAKSLASKKAFRRQI